MTRKAVIYCDAISSDSPSADISVALDPIVAYELSAKGVRATALFDFCPDPHEGHALDRSLYWRLERCLHAESLHCEDHAFAPIAYHQVLLRTSRYLSLKDCIENLIRKNDLTDLWLSSTNDSDLHLAGSAVCRALRINFQAGTGDIATPSNIIHRLGPYGLPRLADPLPLAWIRGLMVRWRARSGTVYSEAPLETNGSAVTVSLKLRRQLSLLESASNRLLKAITGRKVEILTPMENRQPGITLRAPLWRDAFSEDELSIIAAALSFFFRTFPNSLLVKLARNLELFLRAAAPSLVVLSHDRVDINRLTAYCARRCGIPVAYFPHGIVWEDYSEPNLNSPFSPHFVLAWTEDSKEAFRRSGWPGYSVRFPRYQREIRPYKRLPPLTQATPKILFLLPEWIGATRAGREDCFIHDLMQALEGIARLGIGQENLHLKYHNGPNENRIIKEETLVRIQSALGTRLTIIPPGTDSLSIMGNYDLILTSLTSGLYEAVVEGVPVVIVGLSHERIGALARFNLPHARTAEELVTVLNDFNNDAMRNAYREIGQALQSPPTIDFPLNQILRDWPNGNAVRKTA